MDLDGRRFWAVESRRAEGRRERLPVAAIAANAVCAAVLLLAATAASADLRLTDPGSLLYYNYGLVAGTKLQIAERVTVAGSVHSNGPLDLGEHSAVTGNLSAVGKLTNQGSVSGTVTAPAPALTLPVLASTADLKLLANRVLSGNQTFTNAVINDVVYVDGDMTLQGSVSGVGTIIAAHNIQVAEAGGGVTISLDPATRMSFIAGNDIQLGEGRALRGVFYAGRDATLSERSSFEGVVVARRNLSLGNSVVLRFLDLDQTPPTIRLLQPADGALLSSTRPTVQLSWSDDFSGVDLGTLRFLFDGANLTAQATVSATGLTFTPAQALPDGVHAVDVTIADHSANVAHAAFHFTTGSRPPTVTITAPVNGSFLAEGRPAITAAFSDSGSGIDPASVKLLLDGVDRTVAAQVSASGLTFQPAGTLAEGAHAATIVVKDSAGNSGQAAVGFTVDTVPPAVAVTGPAGSLVKTTAVTITGTVSDAGGVTGVQVNGLAAALSGGQFQALVILAEGSNLVQVTATDRAGNRGQGSVALTRDTTPPLLLLDRPLPGQLVNQGNLHVTGSATDANGIASVSVNGAPATLSLDRYTADVPVAEGANTIAVHAVDQAGNSTNLSVQTTGFTLPEVVITAPDDLSFIAATTVDVSGTVSDPAATVTVNGIPASVSGKSFTAQGVPLIEGSNILTASALSANGHAGTASINVVRDLTAPRVTIDYPRSGAVLFDSTITVSGLVNDIVAGTVNAAEATVTVNGRPAVVANRSYVVQGIPLSPGDNTLTAIATDKSGNRGQTTAVVRLGAANVSRLRTISGDRQQAVIGSLLSQPLVVSLLDVAGNPVAGRPVAWSVRGNDGTLDGGKRQIVVPSDAAGRSSVRFTLGTHAGAGTQVVEAVAAGFSGTAVFIATALPGAPSLIVVDSGDLQVGIAGQLLPRPLVAAVTDSGFNRLPGVQAKFAVILGQGHFANGLRELVAISDSDGRVIVPFVLDGAEGIANNVVQATIVGLDNGSAAGFAASSRAAGDPRLTSVSGVILDNTSLPIEGVTLRILDTPLIAQSNAQGQFHIPGVPVGMVKLIVDGSTANRPGSWPDLEFVLTTISGRDNTINMPIYLLPIDLAHGLQVDETHGGTLTLPAVLGFSLDVAAGSVTFPGGSKSGVVSVTAVHSDRVPMVPNFGQQPRFIVTIQPAGARFDPPARLTLPNVEGLAPGQVTEFYSFDHDLGHFVSIGPATVTNDGMLIVSNPGVGIVKAGWHCGGNSATSGTPHSCPTCQKCVNDCCVPDDSQTCDDKDKCTVNDKCQGGVCKGDPVKVDKIDGACVVAKGKSITLTATSNGASKLDWTAPGGTPAKGTGGSFTVTYATEGDKVVNAGCKASSKSKTVTVAPDCASVVAQLKEPEKAGTAVAGTFGNVLPGTKRTAKYKGCANGTKWCFALEEYSHEHSIFVGSSKIDVPSVTAPVVTPTTCAAIIADFTPPPLGTPKGPLRSTYWSRSITQVHERFHVTDVHSGITLKVFVDLKAFVSASANCTDCKSAVPTATFDAKMNSLYSTYLAAFVPGAEARAHNVSNPMYLTLINQIKQRAQNAPASEGWPAACK